MATEPADTTALQLAVLEECGFADGTQARPSASVLRELACAFGHSIERIDRETSMASSLAAAEKLRLAALRQAIIDAWCALAGPDANH
jgi:hypothetical protein